MPKKTAGSSIKVDFTGVEVNSFDVPDGPYVFTVASVSQKKSQESGQPYLSWEFKVDEGHYKGRKVWDNTSLQPQALWKLRNLFECMGMDIDDGEFEVDLEELQGQLVGGEVANEKYQGKDKPRIVGYMKPEDVDSESEEEESKPEPEKPKATGKKKVAAADFEVGQAVTFEDDGETYKGKIHSVADDTVEVKVGKDIWELEKKEVTVA